MRAFAHGADAIGSLLERSGARATPAGCGALLGRRAARPGLAPHAHRPRSAPPVRLPNESWGLMGTIVVAPVSERQVASQDAFDESRHGRPLGSPD